MVGSDTSELSLRLQRVQPVHTVRGLAFNAILALVSERADEETAARLSQELGLVRLVDFFSYPASDFTRLLYAAAGELAPSLGSEQEALRACGAACLHQFFYGSTVGRALAKIMGRKNPQRGFANTSIAYATMVNYGTHECEVLGGRKLRIVFRGDVQPALFHEGTLAAALEVSDVKGTVTTTVHGLDDAEFLLEWEE